jgi:hypothetical protein
MFFAEHSWMQEHTGQSLDSCSHCHEIGLRREDLGSCSSTPLASRSRDVSFNTGGSITGQSLSEEVCSPTFACRSSFSAFVADSAPPSTPSGFSFDGTAEPSSTTFPSMPSFSFFCAQECSEPEPSMSGGAGGEKAPLGNTVAASATPSMSMRMSEVVRTARSVNMSWPNSRRHHTIRAGEQEHLESVIRWASCTNFSTTHSLRASLVC